MNKMYIRKSMLAMGILAIASTGAMAQGTWRNINSKLANPAFIPGWSGALTATNDGVAECYNGAFELYQVVSDAPAGEYTLTANAFYRYSNNDDSKANMKDGANHNAFIFLGTAEAPVEGLFDKSETAPNNTFEANESFAAGNYLNTVTYNHPGGDLRLGIVDKGGRQDEWTCFDNFKLVGPNGEVALVNGDFAEGLNVEKDQTVWDCNNHDFSQKAPDANRGGGVYRKTNASPYNFGQRVELEPGKYRFGVQSFLRHGGAGNQAGQYITCKGAWGWVEGESPVDFHNAGKELEVNNAYVYVTDGWDLADDEVTPVKPVDKEGAEFGKADCFYLQTPIKCMYDEVLSDYPDNEPVEDGVNADGYGWCDSGFEYQAAKLFVNNPELYRNYVEFELPAKTLVYVGFKKDVNAPVQYWNPFRDFTLEVFDASQSAVEAVEVDANAPVEYYNLQGIRVANPENGIYIVKKGNKISKQVIRK